MGEIKCRRAQEASRTEGGTRRPKGDSTRVDWSRREDGSGVELHSGLRGTRPSTPQVSCLRAPTWTWFWTGMGGPGAWCVPEWAHNRVGPRKRLVEGSSQNLRRLVGSKVPKRRQKKRPSRTKRLWLQESKSSLLHRAERLVQIPSPRRVRLLLHTPLPMGPLPSSSVLRLWVGSGRP